MDQLAPHSPTTELSPGTLVGEYVIDCKLGDGGMAVVYGATHPLIGKKAAIKVMNPALSLEPGLVERFVLEARAVNEIGHPNIVDVFSFGRLPDGRSYFVMEWLKGETLYDRLWEARPPLDEALEILDQICDALEAAHDQGIIHRDLKPANVFLCPVKGRRDRVKLLDFGVAKLLRGPSRKTALLPPVPRTLSGQVVGTPDYIAPEQARGRAVDGKVDVYALGVIAYELVVGRRPFEADNVADVVRLHLSAPPPAPRSLSPEIPLALDQLLQRMLAKEPAERPYPAEVRAILRALGGRGEPRRWDLPAVAPPRASPPEAVRPPSSLKVPRRSGWAARGLWALGAALVVGLVWMLVAAGPRTRPAAPTAATLPGRSLQSPPTSPPAKGTLVIRVDASDARIELDGRMLAEAAAGVRVDAEPGEHQLLVTAPGRSPFDGHFVVTAGAITEIPIVLRREPRSLRKGVTNRVAPPVAAATGATPPASASRRAATGVTPTGTTAPETGSTGSATTGAASTGAASTGVATTGAATTGAATTGAATTGAASTRPPGPPAGASERRRADPDYLVDPFAGAK